MLTPVSKVCTGLLCAVAVGSVAAGCAGGPLLTPGYTVRDPPYSWGLVDEASFSLTPETLVAYDVGGRPWRAVGGAVSPPFDGRPANRKVYESGLDPIPPKVHVHWVNENDLTAHDADLAVAGHIPDEPHFSGTLWIVIRDDGPHLEPETDAQELARTTAEARAEDERRAGEP